MKFKTYGLCLFLLLSMSSLNAKDKEKKIDYLALAALLVKGGDFLKAEKALSKINRNDKDLDLARFYTVSGLISLRLQKYDNARDSYLLAQEHGLKDKKLLIYLAQAYYGLEEYANVINSLDKAVDVWVDKPRVWLLKSLSYWSLKDFNQTMETLLLAEERFPDEKQFSQRKILLLIELGLYQEAVTTGLKVLKKSNSDVIDYQTIGKAMLEAGQYRHALPILEKAVLLYPKSVKLIRTLSRTYALEKKYYAAATLLEKGAALDASLLSEVAELYRKAKKSEQALYFNQIVVDQRKKYKQRLAIYLDAGRFDDAIGMRDTLYRVGLLDDDNIRYALAYAYFSLDKYKQSEAYLDGIQQPNLFRKATQLRKAMLGCEMNPEKCY